MLISGTDSFRLAHRKVLSSTRITPWNNFGGNRANIEKSMREVWTAEDGYLFIQPDQSGAEALIVAYLCKPGKYRQLFENNVKPHTYLGFKLFIPFWKKHFSEYEIAQALSYEIPQLNQEKIWLDIAYAVKESDNWPPNERVYHMGKKTCHGGGYGMKANTFRNSILKESGGTIVISHKEAERLLLGFHTEFPEIQNWHIRTYEILKKKGQLRNLFDFPYNVTTQIKDTDYKDFIAWVPQSTVACITRQAFINMQNFIEAEKPWWHLLGDTHDSYVAEAPGSISEDGKVVEGEALECGKIMKSYLAVDLMSPFDGTKFRMKSECSIGKNWGPRKEKKDGTVVNPFGLREIKL
jgi:hypothetical protein